MYIMISSSNSSNRKRKCKNNIIIVTKEETKHYDAHRYMPYSPPTYPTFLHSYVYI